MRIKRWAFGSAAALAVALTGMAQPAGASPTGEEGPDTLEATMAGTLEANPGSRQIAENVIQLDEGITLTLPTSERSVQAASDCPSGWQCAWPHSNFRGPRLAAERCVYLNYFEWVFWNDLEGVYEDFAYDASSVYNNIPGVTWSQFWSPANGANYNAHFGAPEDYVGAQWNDTFTAAQGCSGAAG